MGPDLAGLSEAEKQHPFWRTGLGAAAARRQVSHKGIEPFVLTAHTAHCSLLTAHCSLLTAHCPLLTASYSLLTTHYSLLTRVPPLPPRRAARRAAA